jgi:hypothetical protein
MQEVSTSGSLIRQVAIGVQANSHISLDVDRTGSWLLCLSASGQSTPGGTPSGTLEVSQGGAKPTALTSGLLAAAWL